jgi:hypothetical protein
MQLLREELERSETNALRIRNMFNVGLKIINDGKESQNAEERGFLQDLELRYRVLSKAYKARWPRAKPVTDLANDDGDRE